MGQDHTTQPLRVGRARSSDSKARDLALYQVASSRGLVVQFGGDTGEKSAIGLALMSVLLCFVIRNMYLVFVLVLAQSSPTLGIS